MWNRFKAQCVEWVKSAWRRITWTSLSADTEIGRRSRVLIAAQVIILVIGTLGEVEYMATHWKQFDSSLAVTMGGAICMLLAYFLNRRGYFRVAAGITISVLTITVYSTFWFMREDAYSAGILLYLILPILLSNFVLSWRWYILAAILILAGCLGFLYLPGVVDYLYYLAISSALLGIFNFHNQMLEDSRVSALQESEKRYHHILDSMLEGCQIIDFDWRYVYVNNVFAEQGNSQVDKLLGHTIMEMYPGIENLELFTVLQRCMEKRLSTHMENQFTFPDGSVRWFELSIQPAREGIFILSTDITERKRAEEALRASEERFRDLIKHGRDNISLLAPDGTLLWESPTEFSTLGYEPNHFVERNIFQLMHPDDLAWTQSMFEQIAGVPGQSMEGVFRLMHRDGSWRWIEATATNLLDVASVQAIVVNYRDITERKRAEEALRESEERFSSAFEFAAIGKALVSLDGYWLKVNRTLCKLVGYSEEELSKMTFQEITYPDDLDADLEYIRFILAGELDTYQLEKRYLHKSGEVVWALLSVSLVRNDLGEPIYFIYQIQDVTDRRKAVEALRSSEEKLQLFIQYAPASLAMFDRDMRYLAVSQHWITDYQLGDTELIGRSHYEVFPEITEQLKDVHRRGLNGEVIRSDEGRFVRHNGVVQWLKWEVHPWHAEDGSVGGIIIFSEDITKRKVAEEDQLRHLRELQALNVVSSALRSAQTINEALPILLDQTLIALECEAGEISLYDPTDGLLHVAQARGWFLDLLAPAIRPGEGITGTVFTSGELYHSIEFATDPLLHPGFVKKIPRGWGGAAVPLRTANETVGVLFISIPRPKELSDEAIKLLQALSEMAGAMMHRMRLHEQTARQLMHLQILRTVDLAITSSLDVRLTLDVLFDEILSQMNVDAVGVLFLNHATATFENAVGKGFRTRHYSGIRLRLGEGNAGRCALERETISIHHLSEHPEVAREQLIVEEGFECYHVTPLITKGQVLGVLELFMRTHHELDKGWYDFFDTLSTQAAIAIDNARLFENLQHSNTDLSLAYDATIEGWSRAMDLRDKETEGHTRRVTYLTIKLGHAMGINDAELVHIRRGALLHDMGKMGVPDQILLKPGKLTDEEWVIMRQHPTFAFEMLQPIEFLRPALDIPYSHHEKWDGSGYPRGLKGTQIPLAARIFAVVDVWDALTSDRPYRKGWSQEQAIEYIRNSAGSHFDPKVVEMFLQLIEDRAGSKAV